MTIAQPTWQDDVDPGPVRRGPRERYLAEGWLPIRRLADGRQLVATDGRHRDPAFAAALSAELGAPVSLTEVDPWELKDAVLRLCGEAVADDAANRLFRRNPELSGRFVFSRGQKAGALIAAVVLVVLAIVWPRQTAVGALSVVSLAFLAATAFKFLVALQGARYDVVDRVTDAEVQRLDDADLPVYTVLVPVFREANIVAQLIENLGGLDYPAHKLEVLILIEEEDSETRDAIVHADPPAHFHIVTIPAGQPQTKPRACNVGLTLASG